MAGLALVAYTVGLPAFIGVKVLAPAFYARQDTATPVRIGIAALAVNMVLNVLFLLALTAWLNDGALPGGLLTALATTPGAHSGLALASSGAAWFNCAMLWRALKRADLAPALPAMRLLATLLAGGAMALALVALTPEITRWIDASLGWRIGMLMLVIGGGALVYALVLLAAGLRPRHLARPAPHDAADREDGPQRNNR